MVYLINQDEINRLIAASDAPYVKEPTPNKNKYPTYSEKEVQALMACDYAPTEPKKKK